MFAVQLQRWVVKQKKKKCVLCVEFVCLRTEEVILFGQFRPQTNKQTNRFALRMHDLFELRGREPNLSSDVDQSTDCSN